MKINVTKGSQDYRKIFSSYNEFFKSAERFIINETEDSISFTIATSVTEGRTLKACDNGCGYLHLEFRTNVPIGVYTLDEDDSNEDTLVIYF